jgi:hypothetical protein
VTDTIGGKTTQQKVRKGTKEYDWITRPMRGHFTKQQSSVHETLIPFHHSALARFLYFATG